MTDKEPDDLKKKLIDVIKSLVPKINSPEYRYAEALLIVFNNYAKAGTQAIKFNYKDLYELIKGEDAGRVYVSIELIEKIAKAEDIETHKKLIEEMDSIDNARLSKVKEAQAFMEKVKDALNLITLQDLYNRELIIDELECEIWIAFDLRIIKTDEINF